MSAPRSDLESDGNGSTSSSPNPNVTSTFSSPSASEHRTDVFFSISGSDTCKPFEDNLCKALQDKKIDTYKVVENNQNGGGISNDLKTIIENSILYIIVFSNALLSSKCLEELDEIMKRHKMPGHTAYAVFYDVERTEVRNQGGVLKEAADLEQRWEPNTNDGHEAKLIEEVVHKISQALFAYKHPVLNKLVERKVGLNQGSTFSFIITCLLAFAGLKSQSVKEFPFKTHPNAVMVPVTSLLIYAFAYMADLVVSGAGLFYHTSVYAIIARLGCISSLCLFVTSLAILIYI